MANYFMKAILRPIIPYYPHIRRFSKEEAQYWLQMSKKQDVFPKTSKTSSAFAKLNQLDEFGPPLSPSVYSKNKKTSTYRMGQIFVNQNNVSDNPKDKLDHTDLLVPEHVEDTDEEVDVDINEGCRIVFYDLETTGIGPHNKHKDIEILEIGAVDSVTKNIFRQYIVPPSKNISIGASNVHGIHLKEGVLYRNDEKLEAEEDLKKGLDNFLSWLKSFNQPIILAGYNNQEYDDWVIYHNLLREGLSARDGGVVKFLDVSKIVRPYLKSKFGGKRWNLTYAVKTCLGRSQSDGHSAVSDAMDTFDLMDKLKDEDYSEDAYQEASNVETICNGLALEFSTCKLTSNPVDNTTTIKPPVTLTTNADEILTSSCVNVAMINKSRPITIDLEVLKSQEVFKISHTHNPSIPSVSKVLSATMSEESKAALAKWEQKQISLLGLEGFKQFKKDMFARGHTLHKMLETYMETKQLPKASEVADHVSKRHLVSISQTVGQFETPLLLESAVSHPSLNYCGVVDCVAMVGDTLVLVDWKTSEKVKDNAAALYDNPLQVAAYIGAVNSDERYQKLGNLTKGAVVVVYNSGYPAKVHMFDTKQMEMYWEQWCNRLDMYQHMG